MVFFRIFVCFCCFFFAEGLRSFNSALEEYVETLPESALDMNRSVIFEGERIFVPKKIPRLSRKQKFDLIKLQLDNSETSDKTFVLSRSKKERRALNRRHHSWRRPALVPDRESRKRQRKLPLAEGPHECPKKFDAITQGFNTRTYIFARELVYEVYRVNGLQQKVAFRIGDIFPAGPRVVNAAFTNRRSGVTVLVGDYRYVYRYVWKRQYKQFVPAKRHEKYQLPAKMDFVPNLAFQWKDGHLFLANLRDDKFVSYEPYWNAVLFSGKLSDYIPNLPADAIGLAYNGSGGRSIIQASTMLLMTARGALQVYDLRKSKVVQEYPIAANEYMACLSPKKPNEL